MEPATYALCQKAAIGPALWIAGLCAFPPLISNLALPLSAAGAAVATSFTVPVDKNYQFVLQFEFASTEARLQDSIVGRNYRAECDKEPTSLAGKPEYGRPIPIQVVIRKAKDRSIVVDEQFTSLCVLGHADNRKTRSIGWVALTRGEYTVEVTNVTAQDGLTTTRTFISLVPGGGK
ncbi:MAG TPA: DUF5625 family protein [Burkholderiaceae bacterium]|nr:DUF5625 family protein [Burkholderiaceae bacterium]